MTSAILKFNKYPKKKIILLSRNVWTEIPSFTIELIVSIFYSSCATVRIDIVFERRCKHMTSWQSSAIVTLLM